MDTEEYRRTMLLTLSSKFGISVFKTNEALGIKIFDTDSALRLYELCISDMYQMIEKLNARISLLEIIK